MISKSGLVLASLAMLPFAQPASAGCSATAPKAGTREALFVQQVTDRTPGYLQDFSVPGAAVAVIENGKVILARGFGMADAATGAPVRAQTLFNIGSTSKSVSAWGAMRLVAQGKGRVRDAVALWELNAREYPDDWNVHDSLGDGYAASGPAFAGKAIASFERSLALNPDNAHAREMIGRIKRGEAIAF